MVVILASLMEVVTTIMEVAVVAMLVAMGEDEGSNGYGSEEVKHEENGIVSRSQVGTGEEAAEEN